MNGDGLADIVRLRDGQVIYWPGRGNGFWGTGDRDDCLGGDFATDRHLTLENAPYFGTADAGSLLLADVNGDGLSDLVEVRNKGVDIYLNDNGQRFTDRHIIAETPVRGSASSYVRLTDVDGSGSLDILWGQAYDYQYIDLTGGITPKLLSRVHNGLGKTLELEYESSAELMRQAAEAGKPWQKFAPTVTPVVVRSTVRDNLERIGRPAGVYVTEYSYRDPVYEGRQREFRGFKEATVSLLGGPNSYSSTQRTVFLMGECDPDFEGTVADTCTPPERWRDNWREALKGLPLLNETYDESGVYLESDHTSYQLRQLYTGLDGRRVVVPYPLAKTGLIYDTANFDATETSENFVDVDVQMWDFQHQESWHAGAVRRASAGTARVRSESFYDDYGNVIESRKYGCEQGCPAGVDETIYAYSSFVRPAGDDSGWLYREQSSYLTGSNSTGAWGQASHVYNAAGDLLQSYSVLSGTLDLDRFHESGAAIAPAPPGASGGKDSPVSILMLDQRYDAFGHVVFTRTPNGGCGGGEVDPVYAQLPVRATAYVGAPDAGAPDPLTDCGETQLVHDVSFDRGLEAVIDSVDAHGQPAHFDYDGFGRVLSATHADPATPGQLATRPAFVASYTLPADASTTPYTVTHVRTQDGPDASSDSYHEAWSFTDAMGRTIVSLSQADPSAGDGGDYVAGGAVDYDEKGQPIKAYQPWFYSGSPTSFPLAAPAPTNFSSQEFDGFGRPIRAYGLDGLLKVDYTFHALSQDAEDAADKVGPRQGTYMTLVTDGHGRAVRRTERTHGGDGTGPIEERHTLAEYLPTGAPERIIQRSDGHPDVVRWLKYDSWGRMVLNVEPNTSVGFNPDPTTDPAAIKAWRYAYNDAGDLVGVSDARGCGANYHYDTGGRLLAEDRSPCLDHHPVYSAPDLVSGDGTEAFYRYDEPDPATGSIVDAAGQSFDIDISLLAGRLTSISGPGSKAVMRYDALGRGTGVAVQVQKPGPFATVLADRYAPRWYVRTQSMDGAGRVTTATSGVTSPELLGSDGTSELRFSYTRRGGVRQISSSYGLLLDEAQATADGLPTHMILGDAAATRRDYRYDINRRVEDVFTARAAVPMWSNPPVGSSYTPPGAAEDPTLQLSLEHWSYRYDEVGNVVAIDDLRVASEWPDNAKPVDRSFEYDDLYRLTRTTYTHAGASTWKSPFAAENADPTRVQPSPHVSFPTRVLEQQNRYDHLGNLEQSTDDQSGFWDRSTGERQHGTPTAGPHQLKAASNRGIAGGSPNAGDLDLAYDAAGNVTDLIVRRDGPCLPTAASCWQRFHYEWDELGQITRARRWDLSAATPDERSANGSIAQAPPVRAPDAELRYGYDAGGGRVLKTAVDGAGLTKHSVYIFSSYELRSVDWDALAGDYEIDPFKVQLRLGAGPAVARVLYSDKSLPTLSSGQQHVFLELGDHIGSTSFVIDHATGELVEFATYQAYGAADSDYRPDRWGEFREEYRFTGKEEDIEVGLAYFGARYYSPYLGVWMSADPVAVHDLGSDPNPYAYVYGSPLMGVDPDGREAVLAGMAIAFVVAFTVSVVAQGATNGWNNINWGQAALTGVVSAISAGVGGAISGALVHAGMSVAAAGAIGGMYGGAAGHFAGAALGQNDITARGFLSSMASGAVSGAIGGGLAGKGASPAAGFGSSMVGGQAGYFTSAAITGDFSFNSWALSTGSGIAGAVASGAFGAVCFVRGTLVTTAEGHQKPIEEIELGERLLPDDEACRDLQVSQWQRYDFVVSSDEDGYLRVVEVSLLRPAEWMAGLELGASIWLDLEELGIRGWGRLLSTGPVEGIEDGPGCPVTGTFTGLNDTVMALHFEGVEEPLELTRRHRLFSATRGDWVPAVELEVGEEVDGLEGRVAVAAKNMAPRGAERVFNLEVGVVHAYRVGAVGVLAHNQDGTCGGAGSDGQQAPGGQEGTQVRELTFEETLAWIDSEFVPEALPQGTANAIATLNPALQPLATAHIREARLLGIDARIRRATVTPAEQAAVRARMVAAFGPNARAAPAGQSRHNFGVAYDVQIFDSNGTYVDRGSDARYTTVGLLGESQGLEWGGRWQTNPDMPHFQLTNGVTVQTMAARQRAGQDVLTGR
ncbi:MAG: M15 family metallopeptidase [Myxococcales bacterium]|nr:M15 family metallopeptidase [Myxococcales bacterium]